MFNKQLTYLFLISLLIIIFLFGLILSLNNFNISDKSFVLDSINSYCEKLKNSSNKYIGTNQNIGLANSQLRLWNFENSRDIINSVLKKD